MISIAGIKYQKKLEYLPYFNKNQASILIGKKGKNLDKKIAQLKKIGYLLNLKKGLYTTSSFYQITNKSFYHKYIANILRAPSYLSLEYVLNKEGLIPEAVYSLTSISTKSSRMFNNFLGSFIYRNIKQDLFLGYKEILWAAKKIYIATSAKALFDFLYLKKLPNLKQELISDLRINWDNFKKPNLDEFEEYVKIANSKKMAVVLKIIQKNFYAS